MTFNDWVNLVVSILSGLAICIPLVVKLVQFIKVATKEKNWSSLMQLVLKLMTEAEQLYSTGAERKAYVMATIKVMESTINYDVDEAVLSEMIDSIIDATKKINVEVKTEEYGYLYCSEGSYILFESGERCPYCK